MAVFFLEHSFFSRVKRDKHFHTQQSARDYLSQNIRRVIAGV
jgi:hypothetical protein